MAKRITAALFALAPMGWVAGCAQTHATEDVVPGIYELMAEPEVDACSPSRAVGAMGPVAVLVEDGAIDAPVPEMEGPLLTAPRVVLSPRASFHAETNRRIDGCDAFVHEEWTVIDADEGAFELLHTQEWVGLESCGDAATIMPGAPEADCDSERVLRYTLDSPCLAPCRLILGDAGSLSCACG